MKFKPLIISFCFIFYALSAQAREIIDMRGKKVIVPDNIEKIATLSDGFVENILTHIDEIDKVSVIGSWGLKRDYSYTFPNADGKEYSHSGNNTMRVLHPQLDDLLCVNSPQGNVVNYEALAFAKPDVVIMRVGDCTIRQDTMEATKKSIERIEALNIPLVVLYTPAFDTKYDPSSMKKEAMTIASLFGDKKVKEAEKLMDYVASIEKMIAQRVKNIPENEKKKVLYFGLNPVVREQGGMGNVHGIDTPPSFMIEKLINAKNAFRNIGTNVPMSVEQLYALDPDVILLPTMNGYHPAEELYSAPYYKLLANMRAVQNRQAYALPWTPMNCAPRLEYPLELLVMAKAIYPEKFEDIVFHEFAIDYYQKIYPINKREAEELLNHQILDWSKDANW